VVNASENLTVIATVENVGNETGEQTVDFRLDADQDSNLEPNESVVDKTVNLTSSESTTVSFDVVAPAENGTYRHGIFTDNDSATETLRVETVDDGDGGGDGGPEFTSPINDVSDQLWTEVTGDGTLTLGDLGTAIQEYQGNGQVNGVDISLGDLGSLIQEYQR
jgi:hypothetical protein